MAERRIFCPSCNELSPEKIVFRSEEYPLKKDSVKISAQLYECSNCGQNFVDQRLEDFNYELAVECYRNKYNLLFPAEIKQLRETYELSQRQMAKLLGWGDVTVCLYESGKKIQDAVHNDELVLLQVPSNMLLLLKRHKTRLDEKVYCKFLQRVNELISFESEDEEGKSVLSLFGDNVGGEESGCRRFELKRFIDVVLSILENGPVFKTKLMKLLFYSDFYNFKNTQNSITGLRYKKLPHGPVPEHYESLLAYLFEKDLVKSEFVSFEDGKEGEKIAGVAAQPKKHITSDEAISIQFVVSHFNKYNVTKISKYSHDEVCYIEAVYSSYLDYNNAKHLRI